MDKKASAELHTVTGINDFTNLTPKQHDQLLTQFFNKELTPQVFAALIELAPTILASLNEFIKLAISQVENAGKAQLAALDALKQLATTVDGLKEVALQCKSDKCRMKIASDIVQASNEIAATINKINEQNNSFWRKFWETNGKAVATILGGAIVIIAANAVTSSPKNQKS